MTERQIEIAQTSGGLFLLGETVRKNADAWHVKNPCIMHVSHTQNGAQVNLVPLGTPLIETKGTEQIPMASLMLAPRLAPKNVQDGWLQATSGIQIASANDVPPASSIMTATR